ARVAEWAQRVLRMVYRGMPGNRRTQHGEVAGGIRIEQLFRPHFRVAPRVSGPVENTIRKARGVTKAVLHERHAAAPANASVTPAFPDFEVHVETAISEAFIHGWCQAEPDESFCMQNVKPSSHADPIAAVRVIGAASAAKWFQYLIHDPRGARRADSGAGAISGSVQLGDDRLDQRLVHVRRIVERKLLQLVAADQADRDRLRRRKQQPAALADDLVHFVIFAGGVAPRPATLYAGSEPVCRRDGVLGAIGTRLIGRKAAGFLDRTKHEIQKVERMAHRFEKKASAALCRIDAPRKRVAGAEPGRSRQLTRHDDAHRPDRPGFHQIPDLQEAWQGTAIVADPQRYTGGAA